MVVSDVVLYVEEVQEKISEKSQKPYYTGKFSSGLPFDYPSFFLCDHRVDDGFYQCSLRIGYNKERKSNDVSVSIGRKVEK